MPYALGQKTGLYLAAIEGKGIGLFCSSDINSNEIIEASIAIIFNREEARLIDQTNLFNYYFSLSSLTEEQTQQLNVSDQTRAGCLVMGLISMANHSGAPNASIKKDVWNHRLIYTLTATRDIPANEEITISYGKVWFDIAA